MTLGVRFRYILSFFLLTTVAVTLVGIYLEESLDTWLEAHMRAELRRYALVGRALLEAEGQPYTMEALDRLANQFGQDSTVRITFIAADGQVLGDSQQDGEALRGMANYATQPEVQKALQNSLGEAIQATTTRTPSMLIVAMPFNHPQGGRGVVRTAIIVSDLSSLIHLRGLLFGAGLLFIVFGLFVSNLSAQWMFRPLRYVVERAQEMTSTAHAPQINMQGNDTVAGLANSFNFLAAEKEETLARLSEQQAKMATVLHSMEEGVIAVDKQRLITLMSRSALELFHLSNAQDGYPLTAVLPQEVVDELGFDLDGNSEGRFFNTSTTEFDLDGPPPRRIVAAMTPLHENQGHVIVLRDVTEKRRLEQIRRDFVANVSHELRTPVSVIQANAQTLLGNAMEDPVYRRVLAVAMERNANRLARIIADLLDLSRLEADQFPMEMETLPLHPLVQDVVELIRAAATAKEITVHIDLSAELFIRADAEAMRRILINFLDNAVNYIPHNSSIWVRLNGQSDQPCLEVADDGPGIAPHHMGRLFERFYRVDSGRTRKMGGTGLGLSIVKHLAEKMGERVGMEAVEPHGSVFWVSVSLVRV